MPVRERTGPRLLPHAGPRRLTAPHRLRRRRRRHRDGKGRTWLPTRIRNASHPTRARHGRSWTRALLHRHRLRPRRATQDVRWTARPGPLDTMVLGHWCRRSASKQAPELHRADARADRHLEIGADPFEAEQHDRGADGTRACRPRTRRDHLGDRDQRPATWSDRRRVQGRAEAPVALQGRCRQGRDHRHDDDLHPRHARRHRRPLAHGRSPSVEIIRNVRPPSPSRGRRTSPHAAERLLRRRHDRTDLLRRLTGPGMRPSGLERPRRVMVSGAMENAGNAGRPSIAMRRPKPPPTASSGGSGASMKDAGCRRGWTRAPTTRDGISGRAVPDRPQGAGNSLSSSGVLPEGGHSVSLVAGGSASPARLPVVGSPFGAGRGTARERSVFNLSFGIERQYGEVRVQGIVGTARRFRGGGPGMDARTGERCGLGRNGEDREGMPLPGHRDRSGQDVEGHRRHAAGRILAEADRRQDHRRGWLRHPKERKACLTEVPPRRHLRRRKGGLHAARHRHDHRTARMGA